MPGQLDRPYRGRPLLPAEDFGIGPGEPSKPLINDLARRIGAQRAAWLRQTQARRGKESVPPESRTEFLRPPLQRAEAG